MDAKLPTQEGDSNFPPHFNFRELFEGVPLRSKGSFEESILGPIQSRLAEGELQTSPYADVMPAFFTHFGLDLDAIDRSWKGASYSDDSQLAVMAGGFDPLFVYSALTNLESGYVVDADVYRQRFRSRLRAVQALARIFPPSTIMRMSDEDGSEEPYATYLYFQWLQNICKEVSTINQAYRRLPSLTGKSKNSVLTWPRYLIFKDYQRLLLALPARVEQVMVADFESIIPLQETRESLYNPPSIDSSVTYDAGIVATVLSFYRAHTSDRLLAASSVNRSLAVGESTTRLGRHHTRPRRTGSN